MPSFRENLVGVLSKVELARAKTSFDVIGSIAVLEVDESLRRRQKKIAEALLASHKNIETVLRKDSAHKGEFRVQKYRHLAGQKTTVACHRENGCLLRLDVSRVYFSPRMATERKRIASLVRQGENVLVLFSGCAPYPVVIAKNAKPRQVVGIELNPEGHMWGLANVRANRLRNVFLFCGDARQKLKELLSKRIGLKSHWETRQLKKRLSLKPSLVEFHLRDGDLDNPGLTSAIKYVRSLGIILVLHTPFYNNGVEAGLASKNPGVVESTRQMVGKLEGLSEKFGLRYVMHAYTEPGGKNSMAALQRNVGKSRFMMLENAPFGFFGTAPAMLKLAPKAGLCLDLAHLHITSRDTFYDDVCLLGAKGAYFHVADSAPQVHSCPVGSGEIDFSRVVPFFGEGIVEVFSADENNPQEMIESYRKFGQAIRKFSEFDRIVMPLPRGGEDYLDAALLAARRGTVVHFYDFLHEDDFEEAWKKVGAACRKAGKKFRKLSFVKCGQHSPRTYRVCADFRLT